MGVKRPEKKGSRPAWASRLVCLGLLVEKALERYLQRSGNTLQACRISVLAVFDLDDLGAGQAAGLGEIVDRVADRLAGCSYFATDERYVNCTLIVLIQTLE